jgi:hypothetical protein
LLPRGVAYSPTCRHHVAARRCEDGGIFELLENLSVADEFLRRKQNGIELSMHTSVCFVRRVAMKKFMLHQAIQRAEFGEIAPEHAEIVHEAKGSPDLALARDREEGFPRGDSILECAVNQVQSAADKVDKLRMEFQLADLRVMERTHEAVGIVVENLPRLGLESCHPE